MAWALFHSFFYGFSFLFIALSCFHCFVCCRLLGLCIVLSMVLAWFRHWVSQDIPVVGVGFPLYYATILNGRAVISFFSKVFNGRLPFGLLGFAFVGYAFPFAFG